MMQLRTDGSYLSSVGLVMDLDFFVLGVQSGLPAPCRILARPGWSLKLGHILSFYPCVT